MTEPSSLGDSVDFEQRRLAVEIVDAMKGIRFGTVEIVIHDGKVTQIDRKERFRFNLKLKA